MAHARLKPSRCVQLQAALVSSVAAIASGAAVDARPPLDAARASQVLLPAIFPPAPFGGGAAFGGGLYDDGGFRGRGHLALQPEGSARRIEHLEQPLIN